MDGRNIMNDFNENAREIKNKTRTLYNTAKKKTSEAYYETKDKAEDLTDQLKQTASDVYQSGREKVNQRVNQIEGSIQEQADLVLQSVREKPLTSVLIAAGIGFILAKLINK